MGMRVRHNTETHEPAVWTPAVLGKVAWRREAAAEPFRGIATSKGIEDGVFQLAPTGVDIGPIRDATLEYLDALEPDQRDAAVFPIDHESWRHWANGARYFLRHGLLLEEMPEVVRDRVMNVVRASLSETGYAQVVDIMHLNRTVGELRDEVPELNEWVYWFSVYGDPTSETWGWQLDGHHANVNCVFIGDQMVLTPMFLGAEPVFAESGAFAGTRVFVEEEFLGEHFFRSLTDEQRSAATIADEMPNDLFVGQFRDNLEIDRTGVGITDLTDEQRVEFVRLVRQYTDRANAGHARVRLDEVLHRLDETTFAWIGDPDGVFYYRIHSPVILIEFDHQHGVLYDNDEPTRRHIHTLVRTPNGNDYGVDLLRQHHEQYDHRSGEHIARHEHEHEHEHEHGHTHAHHERTTDDAQ